VALADGALILRIVAIVMLILALAGPRVGSQVETRWVYFVVDLSRSAQLAGDPSQLLARVHQLAPLEPHTRYALIVFGRQPVIEQDFQATITTTEIHSEIDPLGTDIAAALRLALDTFPAQGGKSIILLSDGRATEGGLDEALARAAREGVQISTVPLEPRTSEYWIADLQAPQDAALHLPFTITADVFASDAAQGTLALYRNGELLPEQRRSVELSPGLNHFLFKDQLSDSGIYQYQAVLQVPGDSLAQNNEYTALVEARGGPQILLIASQTPDDSALPHLLRQAGYDYRTITPSEWLPNTASLVPYRAVILDNVELTKLSPDQIASLEAYVRDLGGGLLLIQGRKAVEGFADKNFERMLPISYQGPQELRLPPMAVILILDRSGSMSESAGGARKIDLLKEAAMGTVTTLDPQSLIGILAFTTTYQWIVPLQSADRAAALYPAIQALSPGGGTDLYPALQEAITALDGVQARVKHLIVYTDGKVDKTKDFPQLFSEIQQGQITASAIGIGPDADMQILKGLADVGNGKLYQVLDAHDLPQITLEELRRVARSRWVNGTSPVLPGPAAGRLEIDPASIPPVNGHVLTFPKPTSEVQLLAQGQGQAADALSSYWRYGLGQVAVLNTDLSGEGSASWVRWSGLTKLAAALLGQVYSEEPPQLAQFKLSTELSQGRLQATVDAENDGHWLDKLTFQGQLSGPNNEGIPLAFQQIAPGRYQATSEPLSQGVYLLQLSGSSPEGQPLGEIRRGLSVPYPDEYREIGLDQMALIHMARQTGGLYLEGADQLPPVLLGHAVIYHDIWSGLLLAGLLLFVGDLLARKLPRPS
jgi:Mg-chelatase subunit ChlD